MKFGSIRGQGIRHLFPEFGELWSRGPAILCGDNDMHQSFTDAFVVIVIIILILHY